MDPAWSTVNAHRSRETRRDVGLNVDTGPAFAGLVFHRRKEKTPERSEVVFIERR